MDAKRLAHLRAERDRRVKARMGTGPICRRCGATYERYEFDCIAPLDEPCAGFLAIEKVMVPIERELGLA